MKLIDASAPDVMQVCRNGHVITDLLHTFPEQARGHCEQCGAATLEQCLTCGREIPGAIFVPGAVPVGHRSPPHYCSACGAAFPWTDRPRKAQGPAALAILENLLRQFPLVVRHFRDRSADRPAFTVNDERDLEYLVRALLPLHFNDVRPESRTPRYSALTRTDLLLSPSGMALTLKRATPDVSEAELGQWVREDIEYYRQRGCRVLVYFVYDPEALLRNPRALETQWAGLSEDLRVYPIIAS
jgi:hypothetical protein